MSQVEEESLCKEVLDPKKRKLVENVEDSDEKDTKNAKIEEEKEEIEFENESQMEKLMENPNMWHIHDNIFGHLNHDTVEICRQVCKSWNESLKRTSHVKFLQEFGDREVEHTKKKVSTIIAEWKSAVEKYVFQASLEDLQKVKDSLLGLLVRKTGKCCYYPVHIAAKNGAVKLMELILRTSFDMNTKVNNGRTTWHFACISDKTEIAQLIVQYSKDFGIDLNTKSYYGRTAWHEACYHGQTETAQLIIQSSKEFGIDLNTKDNYGRTAWHEACINCRTETAQLIIQSSKEFGIDVNARDDDGNTALHFACNTGRTEIVQLMIKHRKEFGIYIKTQNNQDRTALDITKKLIEDAYSFCFLKPGHYQIIEILEHEYSKMDVTDQAA